MSKNLEETEKFLNKNCLQRCHHNSNESCICKVAICLKEIEKAQEQEKVLKILFEKRVDMWHLVDLLDQDYEMYVAFCKSEGYDNEYILTEEEYDTLKEVL